MGFEHVYNGTSRWDLTQADIAIELWSLPYKTTRKDSEWTRAAIITVKVRGLKASMAIHSGWFDQCFP